MISRRRLLKLGLAAPLGVALAPRISRGATQPVTIQYATWAQAAEVDITNAMIKIFESKNPGIKVDLQVLPLNEYYAQLETRMSGGKAPDVFRAVYSNFGRYGGAGQALDLTPLIPKGMDEEFSPSLWGAVNYKGKPYAIPAITDNVAFFYNVKFFEKAGIKPPTKIEQAWTWEQLMDIGNQMMAKAGAKFGFTSYGRSPKSWHALLRQNGGSYLNEDQTKPAINEPAAVEAIEWFVNTFKKMSPPSSLWNRVDSSDQLFATGATGFAMSGMWMLPYFDANVKDFKYSVTYISRRKILTSDFGGSGLAISPQSKKVKEAWAFVSYMTGEEGMLKYCAEGYFIPPRKKVAEMIKYPAHNEELRYFLEQVKVLDAKLVKDYIHPRYPQMEVVMKEEIEQAVLGKKTPKEAADSAAERIAKLL